MRWLAFLILFIPNLAWAALPAGTVWELRTAGSDTNSGCFIAGGTGTDYSQQNAAQYALTNGTYTSGTTISTTSASADMKDNCVYVSGGSGSITPIRKWITAVSVGTSITVDSSTGLVAGNTITLNVGGALATWATLAASMTTSNNAFVKGGPYTVTSGVTFSQSGGTPKTQIIGYTTTRRDGGQATITANAAITLVTVSNNTVFQMYNLTFDCNNQSSCTGLSTSFANTCWNCKAKNYTVSGFSGPVVFYSEATGGAIGATSGITSQESAFNYVHDGVGPGIIDNGVGGYSNYNIIANQSGASSDCLVANANITTFYGNIAYNCGRDGLHINGSNAFVSAFNNIFDSNGGYGINAATAQPATPLLDGNAYYNNTSGARNNVDSTTASSSNPSGVNPYTNTRDITLSGDPFVNAAGNNFALNNTGGAGALLRAHGFPLTWSGLATTTSYLDMGPVQHQDPVAPTGYSAAYGQ